MASHSKASHKKKAETYFLFLGDTRIFASFDEKLPYFSNWMSFFCWWGETTTGQIYARPCKSKAASIVWYNLFEHIVTVEVHEDYDGLTRTIKLETCHHGVYITEVNERSGAKTKVFWDHGKLF